MTSKIEGISAKTVELPKRFASFATVHSGYALLFDGKVVAHFDNRALAEYVVQKCNFESGEVVLRKDVEELIEALGFCQGDSELIASGEYASITHDGKLKVYDFSEDGKRNFKRAAEALAKFTTKEPK